MRLRLFSGLLVLALLNTISAASAIAEELLIHAGGSAYRFTVEIADTGDERAQGLMFRAKMAPNAGMLFLYPTEQPVTFWMKNTLIPLDMLFVAANGEIKRIEHDATPLSETQIPSDAPVKAVLELNGGTAQALGIKPGDRIDYPGLGTP